MKQQEINERIAIILKDMLRELTKNDETSYYYVKFQYIIDKVDYLTRGIESNR